VPRVSALVVAAVLELSPRASVDRFVTANGIRLHDGRDVLMICDFFDL
jgi:hypothetical protein